MCKGIRRSIRKDHKQPGADKGPVRALWNTEVSCRCCLASPPTSPLAEIFPKLTRHSESCTRFGAFSSSQPFREDACQDHIRRSQLLVRFPVSPRPVICHPSCPLEPQHQISNPLPRMVCLVATDMGGSGEASKFTKVWGPL